MAPSLLCWCGMNVPMRVTAAAMTLGAMVASCTGGVRPLAEATSGDVPACREPDEVLRAERRPKIDLLLAIDNSPSMTDKQIVLALTVPDLVERILNPRCVTELGAELPSAMQPAGPGERCPSGSYRETAPIEDVHIGVISSSLGSAGADACASGAGPGDLDDHGRLLARTGGAPAPTYAGKGFLAWDPAGTHLVDGQALPGEADLGAIVDRLQQMVIGVGQLGCRYEAALESWYRFLVDPEPYESIAIVDGKATPIGIDQTLLAQRAAFLRPDSSLVIVMIGDENDCSIIESGQGYYAAKLEQDGAPYHLPPARAECAVDPGDPCCRSCGSALPAECPVDPTCAQTALEPAEDPANLRCFDQKRRFGIDFLYPTSRYVTALTEVTIANRNGELVANPIFSDLDPSDAFSNIRGWGRVFLAGVVGVPWQDIARDPADPDQGWKTSEELAAGGVWDLILGDPASHVPPLDPHMVESIDPRTGVSPVTGEALAPPGSPNGADSINGHELTIAARDNLQYACVFGLPAVGQRDCSGGVSGEADCDCADPDNDSPLCEANPADGGQRTLQVSAKAYPSLRQLEVLRGLDTQGFVGSICPVQLHDVDAWSFGYRSVLRGLLDRLAPAPALQCLPRRLPIDRQGQVGCSVIEARRAGGTCICDPTHGRVDVPQAQADVEPCVEPSKVGFPIDPAEAFDCFCGVVQLSGDALDACRKGASHALVAGQEVHGWCYADDVTESPDLEGCREGEQQGIRFVGESTPLPDAALSIHCPAP
jgi:hypothetical protein